MSEIEKQYPEYDIWIKSGKKRKFFKWTIEDLEKDDLIFVIEGMAKRYEVEMGRIYTHAFDPDDATPEIPA